MTITFLHHGIERTLVKHPTVAHALKHGRLTAAQAAEKPWYLRLEIDGRDRSFKMDKLARAAVIVEARDWLNSRASRPNEFAAWLAAKDTRKTLTIGQLATDWIAAGLPFSKTKPRAIDPADRLRLVLERALPWWTDKPATTIDPTHHADYVVWRRAHTARGIGNRAVDKELSALSSLCQWAVLSGKLALNPFAVRERFQAKEEVRHCHEFAPRSDEDFHAILRWFWRDLADHETVTAGAWLCFTALVGLRPEEPAALLRVPRLSETPADPKLLAPGTIFPLRDGTLKMRVWRNKHGQNPFITLHPAALAFLTTWQTWLATNIKPLNEAGEPARWFPGIDAPDTTILNRRLSAACDDLKLAILKPKGFGRAYYVRVRRSAGIEDSQIAMELGQTTNGKLIRDTYGDPEDLFASELLDWLPKPTQEPAWQLLRQVPVQVTAPTGTRYGNDTAETHQDTPKMPEDRNTLNRENPLPASLCR